MTDLRGIVRVINADIPGTRSIYIGLTKVHGVSYSFSNVVCNLMNFDKQKKIGTLSPEEVKKIEDLIKNPSNHGIPAFLYNRKKDVDSGQDMHLVAHDLRLRKEFDIKMLKKTRSYRGIRHALGQPTRGQRTRSHFRQGKTVGVTKGKVKSRVG
ncbi:30S ribosomal protein S13 [Candidatus Woesearchaeota archaeon]|nr:30S ribosomal protein S13 [Candidatus Woesearchaeota archaeon]